MKKELLSLLKIALKEKEYTYETLSEELNISKSTVANMLNGYQNISMSRFVDILHLLELPTTIKIGNTTIRL